MRYVCKNCKRFVSKDAERCKCCGELNPAIPKITGHNKESQFNYGFENQYGNPDSSKKNNTMKWWGIFIASLVLVGIVKCSESSNQTTSTNTQSTTSSSYADYSNSNSYESYGSSDNTTMSSSSTCLMYKVYGSQNPSYYWIINGTGMDRKFEYVIMGESGKTVLESGDCVVTTFGMIKQLRPNTVLRDGVVDTNSTIYYMGPLDLGTYGFDVYAMLVVDGQGGQVYLNDGPKPLEFLPIDRVILQ